MIYAGTGHRPTKLGGYGGEPREKLEEFAIEILNELALKHDGNIEIISGMALGWDMALAVAATELGLEWTAAIPFEGQESRWPDEAQERYWDIRRSAERECVVSDGGYAVWKMQTRNEWMVDRAGVMLALWNGSQAGGTYNCVTYAERTNVPVINVWHKWEEFNA